jgi:hypothetical protein
VLDSRSPRSQVGLNSRLSLGLVRHIVLVLVVPTSLRTARIAHSTKSYVGTCQRLLTTFASESWPRKTWTIFLSHFMATAGSILQPTRKKSSAPVHEIDPAPGYERSPLAEGISRLEWLGADRIFERFFERPTICSGLNLLYALTQHAYYKQLTAILINWHRN